MSRSFAASAQPLPFLQGACRHCCWLPWTVAVVALLLQVEAWMGSLAVTVEWRSLELVALVHKLAALAGDVFRLALASVVAPLEAEESC